MPKNKNTRREFIKVISVAPVGALFLNLGCSGVSNAGVDVAKVGNDAGVDTSVDVGRDSKHADDSGSDASSTDVSNTNDSGGDVDVEPEVCDPSGSDVEGPFHEPGAPERTKLVSAGEQECH